MPEWAEYVKTGVDRERPPQQEDWWYIRSAAVLRKIYKEGPLGTETLRSMYGGKHRRGHQTEHFEKASGKVIRTVLQQLEDADLVELEEGEGRQITPDGQRLLDAV
ncbi:MAG: 30S ribosomal protein S19e, partial [Candidatus Nanohaloarchaea archaeon]